MYQICTVHVYIYKERLGYVIFVPLVHKRTFSVLRMIPIPVHMNQDSFLYVDAGEALYFAWTALNNTIYYEEK